MKCAWSHYELSVTSCTWGGVSFGQTHASLAPSHSSWPWSCCQSVWQTFGSQWIVTGMANAARVDQTGMWPCQSSASCLCYSATVPCPGSKHNLKRDSQDSATDHTLHCWLPWLLLLWHINLSPLQDSEHLMIMPPDLPALCCFGNFGTYFWGGKKIWGSWQLRALLLSEVVEGKGNRSHQSQTKHLWHRSQISCCTKLH